MDSCPLLVTVLPTISEYKMHTYIYLFRHVCVPSPASTGLVAICRIVAFFSLD